jgi:hypothetical protein
MKYYNKIEEELLDEIKKFTSSRGMSEGKFGLEAINDHKLVSRLENGREVRSGTINTIRRFMANYDKDLPKKGSAPEGKDQP